MGWAAHINQGRIIRSIGDDCGFFLRACNPRARETANALMGGAEVMLNVPHLNASGALE
jgi:hypothetical protein